MRLQPEDFFYPTNRLNPAFVWNRYKCVNLNNLYNLFIPDFKLNPLEPSNIQRLLVSAKADTDSYGGYGEDRSIVWKDSYLKESGNFIHLGIDIQMRRATKVYAPFDCQLEDVFTDTDTKIGWGGRLILKKDGLYIVLAHLEPSTLLTDTYAIKQGTCLGEIGTWPTNGNTFEHLHVQVKTEGDFENFDGYGTVDDLKKNPNIFEIDWT